MVPLEEEIRVRLEHAGQSHLLRFWPELDPAQRNSLLEALAQLDAEELSEHCQRAAEAFAQVQGSGPERLDGKMKPVPPEFLGSTYRSDPVTLKQWEVEGRSSKIWGCAGRSWL